MGPSFRHDERESERHQHDHPFPLGLPHHRRLRSRIPHDRPAPEHAPTIVMLHEGLGSAGLWGDFPEKLQAATGAGVFVYSRAGYGASTPVKLPRPLDYMHVEALDVLPKLLDAIGFRRGLLLGHSDGASIAAIYAGSHQDHRVQGIAMIAPHFIVEDISVASIARDQDRLRDHGAEGEAGALAQGCRQRLLWLERRLARSRRSATGIFPNISPISASRSRSCRVWTTSMGPCGRSRSRRKSAIVRSM